MNAAPTLLAATLLVACTQPERHTLAAGTPAFDPVTFFDGQVDGVGVYRRVLHRPKQVVTQITGRHAEDHLQLTQRVLIEDQAPIRRTWDLYRVAPGRWRGKVTTASDPVLAEVRGNALHLRYTAESGFRFDEWYYLQPDGHSAINRTIVTDLGVDFARIEGTLRRRPTDVTPRS